MAEYIEREAAIKAIYDSDPNGIRRTLGFSVGQIEEALRATPAADVAPVRHGRWIKDNDGYYPNDHYCLCYDYTCSECSEVVNDRHELPKFCPGCGADMRGAK